MGRWRPLPDTLDPDLHRLVEQLRRLKDRSGLSLVALAERTSYSKSAWQRYLNGAKFPPRQAVEALGKVAGADALRLLALWSIAERSHLDALRRYQVAERPPADACDCPAPPGPDAAERPPRAPAQPALPGSAPGAPVPPAEPGPPTQGSPCVQPRRGAPRRRIAPAAPAVALAALLAALLYVAVPATGGPGVRILRDTIRSLLVASGRTTATTPRAAAARPDAPTGTPTGTFHRGPVSPATANCRSGHPYAGGCIQQTGTRRAVPMADAEPVEPAPRNACAAVSSTAPTAGPQTAGPQDWGAQSPSPQTSAPQTSGPQTSAPQTSGAPDPGLPHAHGALAVQSSGGVPPGTPAAPGRAPGPATAWPAHLWACTAGRAFQVCAGDPRNPAPPPPPQRTDRDAPAGQPPGRHSAPMRPGIAWP
ncbi:helix-turn-helix domain-containing protein [Peterkaempfera sp. SMS 1(5)a]|uniref:transcriptional regulator n=1 Tax=Peterkaempfera podocarpi TaxID=3232308 RepID=UPI00366EEC88